MDYYYGEETKENQGEKKLRSTEVAKEVLAGDWGNGDDRKNRLAAAGYDYANGAGRSESPCRSNLRTGKRALAEIARKSLQDSGEMAMTERTASRQQDMTTMQSRKRSMHSLE